MSNCVYRAWELSEKTITGRFKNASAVLVNFRIDYVFESYLETRECIFFIGLHQT